MTTIVTKEQVVEEARSYLGTPFKHQGRLKGIGIDCVGLITCVAHTLDISQYDTVDYNRQPDPVMMGNLLDGHLDRIAVVDGIRLGDILWMRFERQAQHLGIVVQLDPMKMVHAFSWPGVMKCVEHEVTPTWNGRILRCYRYRYRDSNRYEGAV